ncbi:MAG: hypothetical protein ACREXV_02020 [Polaromonas sp.]
MGAKEAVPTLRADVFTQSMLLTAVIGGGAVLAGVWWLGAASPTWVLITFAAIAVGVFPLAGAHRTNDFLSAPQWTLVASALLMYTGLAVDVIYNNVLTIAELCLTPGTVVMSFETWLRHVEAMPMMHAGMLAGGTVAFFIVRDGTRRAGRRTLYAQVCFHTICLVVMLFGMSSGIGVFRLVAQLTGLQWNGMAMLGGMITGMVWIMWLLVSVGNWIFDRRECPVGT